MGPFGKRNLISFNSENHVMWLAWRCWLSQGHTCSLCSHVMHLRVSGHNDGYYWCQSSPVMGECLMLSGLIFSFSPGCQGMPCKSQLLFHHVHSWAPVNEALQGEGRGQDLLPLPHASTCGPLKRRLVNGQCNIKQWGDSRPTVITKACQGYTKAADFFVCTFFF